MKRSDHVSLCTTASASKTEKKLRKRRELNAMAAPHVIVRGRSARRRPPSKTMTTAHLLGNGGLEASASSSFNDDFEDTEDLEHDANGYINLRGCARGHGHKMDLKKYSKFIRICHQFCLVFVIFSGLLVLITLAWLHFSLRAQTRDLAFQLQQG